jgi:cobalt-zinc-cadmium efflux system outer membrane protein
MNLNMKAHGPSGLMSLVLVLVTGCQSYRSMPLELDSYTTKLEQRLLDTDRVAEFAAAMYEEEGKAFSFDLADEIDCSEAEALALFYNPSLRMVRAEAGLTRAVAKHAGLWQDPEFGFDAAQILSPGSQFDFGGTLALTLPISGRLGIERDREGAAHEAALLRIADEEWNLRMDVRRAWALWVLADGRVRQFDQFSKQFDELMVTIDGLVEIGELGRVEGRLVRIEWAVQLAEFAESKSAEREARGLLLGQMGLPADSAVVFANRLPAESARAIDHSAGRLMDTNTAIAVVVAEYEVAEHALRYEVRKQFPDISLGGGFGSEDDDERLLFGISLPIPVLNANKAGIANAHAARDAAGVRAELMLDQITRDLYLAKARSDAVRAQRELYETDIAPMLDEQTKEIRDLAGLGEIRTLVLLKTITNHMETRRRLLELSAALSISGTEILRILGPGIEDRGPLLIDDVALEAGGVE